MRREQVKLRRPWSQLRAVPAWKRYGARLAERRLEVRLAPNEHGAGRQAASASSCAGPTRSSGRARSRPAGGGAPPTAAPTRRGRRPRAARCLAPRTTRPIASRSSNDPVAVEPAVATTAITRARPRARSRSSVASSAAASMRQSRDGHDDGVVRADAQLADRAGHPVVRVLAAHDDRRVGAHAPAPRVGQHCLAGRQQAGEGGLRPAGRERPARLFAEAGELGTSSG